MNVLCWLGLHRWRTERLLEQHMETCTAYLEGDVCSRCEAVRNPENMANVYNLMSNYPWRIVVHPSSTSPTPRKEGE